MAWILLLALAALAAAVAIASRRGLVELRDAMQDAWAALENQLVKRQELIVRIVELCARLMREEQPALARVSNAGTAVIAAARIANVPALAAADKSHRAAVATLFSLAAGYPQLATSAAFAALRDRVATLDARVDDRREQYNTAVSVLNFRCFAFPHSLVARSIGMRPAVFLS
ncbi:MAG: LemA family protein [Steroidobacteraceae bacterium]